MLWDLADALRCTAKVKQQMTDIFSFNGQGADFNTKECVKVIKKIVPMNNEEGFQIGCLLSNKLKNNRETVWKGIGKNAPNTDRHQRELISLRVKITQCRDIVARWRIFELQPGRSVCYTLNNKDILGVIRHQLCQGVDSHHIPAIVASTNFEAKFPASTMLRYETNNRVLNSSSSALPFHEEDAIFRTTSLDLLRSIVPHDFQEYLENEEFINSDIMFAPPEQHSD